LRTLQVFGKGRSQLDVRLSRHFRVGPRIRLQANVDICKVLNANTILGVNNTHGSAAWLRPTAILDARLIEFGGKLTF